MNKKCKESNMIQMKSLRPHLMLKRQDLFTICYLMQDKGSEWVDLSILMDLL